MSKKKQNIDLEKVLNDAQGKGPALLNKAIMKQLDDEIDFFINNMATSLLQKECEKQAKIILKSEEFQVFFKKELVAALKNEVGRIVQEVRINW